MIIKTNLHNEIMERDHCLLEEADELVQKMRISVLNGQNPEEVLYDEGLEADYILDILP